LCSSCSSGSWRTSSTISTVWSKLLLRSASSSVWWSESRLRRAFLAPLGCAARLVRRESAVEQGPQVLLAIQVREGFRAVQERQVLAEPQVIEDFAAHLGLAESRDHRGPRENEVFLGLKSVFSPRVSDGPEATMVPCLTSIRQPSAPIESGESPGIGPLSWQLREARAWTAAGTTCRRPAWTWTTSEASSVFGWATAVTTAQNRESEKN
jgi:hypothetical protein